MSPSRAVGRPLALGRHKHGCFRPPLLHAVSLHVALRTKERETANQQLAAIHISNHPRPGSLLKLSGIREPEDCVRWPPSRRRERAGAR